MFNSLKIELKLSLVGLGIFILFNYLFKHNLLTPFQALEIKVLYSLRIRRKLSSLIKAIMAMGFTWGNSLYIFTIELCSLQTINKNIKQHIRKLLNHSLYKR